jgi:hypothetical protein
MEFFSPIIVLILIYALAWALRPYVTDRFTGRYFLPALTVKIIGALALGLIYYYYYKGGDTIGYTRYGSRHIWLAFQEDPMTAIRLILHSGRGLGEALYPYSGRIHAFGDPASYFVVRAAGLMALLTANNYWAIAMLFAAISFSGVWALYLTFYHLFPRLHGILAFAVLFIPSVLFWGSGIMKDTITLGALGWLTYSFYRLFILKKIHPVWVLLFLLSAWVLYVVKIYILLCFLPSLIFWVAQAQLVRFPNPVLRIMLGPAVLGVAVFLAYFSMRRLGEEDPRYNLDRLMTTAQVTAEWIHYASEMEGGSTYTLGDFDFSPAGMARKFVPAVIVTLYRPFLWEARNVVMIFSALESLALLLLSFYVLFRAGPLNFIRQATSEPILVFCFLFALVFAFAVGVTSYNFGSLVRYKIPMLPFFVSALFVTLYKAKGWRYG